MSEEAKKRGPEPYRTAELLEWLGSQSTALREALVAGAPIDFLEIFPSGAHTSLAAGTTQGRAVRLGHPYRHDFRRSRDRDLTLRLLEVVQVGHLWLSFS